jgi:hypothetical protein
MNAPRLSLCLTAATIVLWPAVAVHAALDAVSGASVSVSAPTVTTTTATIKWTFTHGGGTGKIYYGTTRQSSYSSYPSNATATSSGNSFTAALSSLGASTTYYYTVTVSGGGYPTSTSTGSFTTATAAIRPTPTARNAAKAPTTDIFGRRKGDASGIAIGKDGLDVQIR